MSQSTLPVRTGDPDTSSEAAEKAALGASKIRPDVLGILREQGPLTHDELITAYRALIHEQPWTPRASDSGIRTRLKELAAAGLVVEDEKKGHSTFGNSAKRWKAVI